MAFYEYLQVVKHTYEITMFFHGYKNWRPRLWCKPICVSTSFPFLCWFLVACIINDFFLDFPFWNQCCLHWFSWPSNKSLEMWGCCLLFLNLQLYLLQKGLDFLCYTQHPLLFLHSIIFCCLVVAISFAHLWYLPISNLH